MVSRDDQVTQRHAAIRDPEMVFAEFVNAANASTIRDKGAVAATQASTRSSESNDKRTSSGVTSRAHSETTASRALSASDRDAIFDELMVFVQQGYGDEVKHRLAQLCAMYADDCLLLTRAGELYVKLGLRDEAMKTFLAIADRLLEEGNTNGVRNVLDEVLAIDPGHRRAHRILVTLSRRPDTRSPREGRLRVGLPHAGR